MAQRTDRDAERPLPADEREARRQWMNTVLRLIQRHFPHIPMSEHGDESRRMFMAFADDVARADRAARAASPSGAAEADRGVFPTDEMVDAFRSAYGETNSVMAGLRAALAAAPAPQPETDAAQAFRDEFPRARATAAAAVTAAFNAAEAAPQPAALTDELAAVKSEFQALLHCLGNRRVHHDDKVVRCLRSAIDRAILSAGASPAAAHSLGAALAGPGSPLQPPAAASASIPSAAEASFERMFNAAVASLAEVSAALGIDDQEAACANGNELILMEINALQLEAEEVECAHKALDDMGIPRSNVKSEPFSLVGRIQRIASDDVRREALEVAAKALDDAAEGYEDIARHGDQHKLVAKIAADSARGAALLTRLVIDGTARGMEARSGETEGLDPAGATARSATADAPNNQEESQEAATQAASSPDAQDAARRRLPSVQVSFQHNPIGELWLLDAEGKPLADTGPVRWPAPWLKAWTDALWLHKHGAATTGAPT